MNQPYRFLIFLFGMLCSIFSYGQSSVDAPVGDTNDVRTLLEIANGYTTTNTDSAAHYFLAAIALAEEINDTNGRLHAYGPLGYLYQRTNASEQAETYYLKSFTLKSELADTTGMIYTLFTLGALRENHPDVAYSEKYYRQVAELQLAMENYSGVSEAVMRMGDVNRLHGKFQRALLLYDQGLSIGAYAGDGLQRARILNRIGLMRLSQADYTGALAYLEESYELFKVEQDSSEMGTVLSNIGLVYTEEEKWALALDHFYRAKKLKLAVNDEHGLAYALNNIGTVYLKQYRTDKELDVPTTPRLLDTAIFYFQNALKIRTQGNYKRGMSLSNCSLGQAKLLQNQPKVALPYLQSSYDLAKEIGNVEEIRNAALLLSEAHERLGKGTKALEMYKEYTFMNDSINNREAFIASTELQARYAYEKKKMISDAAYEKQLSIAAEKRTQQQLITIFVVISSIVLFILLIALFKRLRITRKQKQIIEDQKEEVDTAYDKLAEKNTEILDSINYAQRIQSAILPPDELFKKHLPNSFIYYQPKDVVAGDFYWLEPTTDLILFAAADCTGHGVPGAMVSVVCNNALNRSVREYGIREPGKILDKTRAIVIDEFAKGREDVKDGMDIALCALKGNQLWYAGANNPLWLIRNGELTELKATKQPIGKFDHPTDFETHKIDLLPGDTFYIFSDGYADQFGGEKGKKFKAANLKRLFISIDGASMEDQKKKLADTFQTWKGDLEQLDDVCVIGVRV